MATDPYLVPGTDVLRNLPGFIDPDALQAFEFEATYGRGVQLRRAPITGGYDLDHVRAFHRHLFQDVYDWAGELRTVNIFKGNTPFAYANAIIHAATELFDQLAGENYLHDLDHHSFVTRAAHYLTELNALHPFREGNGRTQRAFLAQLANAAGWHIDWDLITAVQNIAASITSFAGSETAFVELLETVTTPSTPTPPLRVVRRRRPKPPTTPRTSRPNP